MMRGVASLRLDRLNRLVDNRIGVVLNFLLCDVGARSARNELHKYLVYWQERWG